VSPLSGLCFVSFCRSSPLFCVPAPRAVFCVEAVQLALDSGADVHATVSDGATALHHAVMKYADDEGEGEVINVDKEKRLQVVQMLVENDVNVAAETNGMTALAMAEEELPENSPAREFLAGLHAQGGGQ